VFSLTIGLADENAPTPDPIFGMLQEDEDRARLV